MGRQLVRSFALLVLISLLPLVAQSQCPVEAQIDERCFAETTLCIKGRIRDFWEKNGGLPVFGNPITPQRWQTIAGKSYEAQWFERNRLELHPETAPPYDVQLGLLGGDVLKQQQRNWYAFEPAPQRDGCLSFETGHSICGAFLDYWRNHGLSIDNQLGFSYEESLGLFGMPLSSEQQEQIVDNTTTVTLTVQWFERARFEMHPNQEAPVLLGLLGHDMYDTMLKQRVAFFSDRDGNSEIYFMGTTSGIQFRLTDDPAPDEDPAWSPDGNSLAFDTYRDGNWEIYSISRQGGEAQRLTNHDAIDAHPSWSPDGRRIAFDSNRDGNYEIYAISSDGSGSANLSNHPDDDGYPTWSPDGSRLAFQSQRDGNWEIYLMNSNGSGAVNLTRNSATDARPAWSPDGRRLAFQSNRDGKNNIYVINADGSGATNLTATHEKNYQQPAWVSDDQLVVQSDKTGDWEIYMLAADGSSLQNLTEMPTAADKYPASWSE